MLLYIMAAVGTGFSLTCLGLIVWLVWSGIRQASWMAERQRKAEDRILHLGQHVIVDGREGRVN